MVPPALIKKVRFQGLQSMPLLKGVRIRGLETFVFLASLFRCFYVSMFLSFFDSQFSSFINYLMSIVLDVKYF